MADTIESLEAELERVHHERTKGISLIRFADRELRYRSDPELAAAQADLERRLNNLRRGRITTIRLSASKGF